MFGKLLMEHPKLQRFYADFSQQLTSIIESEILANSEAIGLFMMHPHRKNSKLSARNFENSVLIMNPDDLDAKLVTSEERAQEKNTSVTEPSETKTLNFVEQAIDMRNTKKYSDFQMELILKA